jgi:hypothetical protein
MSLVKQEVAPSAFIDEPTLSKVDGRTVAKKAYKQAVNRHSTIYTLWLLAVKHKVGLLMVGNIILVMNFILPEWPSMALGLIGK